MTPDLLPERITAKVRVTDRGCWEWTGCTNGLGYGQVSVDKKMRYVHRVAYELLVGPLVPGMEIDHLCRVRGCLNPEHLEPVTHRQNTLRGDTVTAANARKTHCVNGHAFTPENTYTTPVTGWRRCRACRAAPRST